MYNFYIDKKGYPRYIDSKKLVHRVVASNILGRPLTYNEVVHHKDKIKRNFRKNNLQVMFRRAHSRIHAGKRF